MPKNGRSASISWPTWLFAFFTLLTLSLLAMERFRLVSSKDLPLWVPLGVAASAVVGLRARVFEAAWVKEYRPRGWILLLGLGVACGVAALGLVVFLNGALDRGSVVESRRLVVAMDDGGTAGRAASVTFGCDGCESIEWVGQAPPTVRVGSTVIVRIGPGLFRLPWLKGIEYVAPDHPVKARALPPAPQEQSVGQLVRVAIFVGWLVVLFRRWKASLGTA